MDRTRLRTPRTGFQFSGKTSGWIWPVAIVLTFIGLIAPTGCGWLSLMMYNFNPDDTPADFTELQGKRVVVVSRPVVELQFADSSVPSDLTKQIGLLLQKVRKIDVVDDREVSQWTDEHQWQKFTDVGKAMKADMVVGVELEPFSLQQGPTLLQGNAAFRVEVHDMANGGRIVYEKTVPRFLYPPQTPIPSAERSEAEFRRLFINVLAEQIARHFYAHNSFEDFDKDTGLGGVH